MGVAAGIADETVIVNWVMILPLVAATVAGLTVGRKIGPAGVVREFRRPGGNSGRDSVLASWLQAVPARMLTKARTKKVFMPFIYPS
jgi:hypothetical protein